MFTVRSESIPLARQRTNRREGHGGRPGLPNLIQQGCPGSADVFRSDAPSAHAWVPVGPSGSHDRACERFFRRCWTRGHAQMAIRESMLRVMRRRANENRRAFRPARTRDVAAMIAMRAALPATIIDAAGLFARFLASCASAQVNSFDFAVPIDDGPTFDRAAAEASAITSGISGRAMMLIVASQRFARSRRRARGHYPRPRDR